jgi:photosystem II stability/assembly factor-like uncharacterized protein
MRLTTLVGLALLLATPATAQHWAPVPSGTSAILADVHFTSNQVGFAVADGGLLLSTSDGGDSWTSRVLNAGLDNQGIAFSPSGSAGLIVTDGGGVLRTIDGGVTWTLIPTGMSDGRAAIAWGNETVVWVAGRDGNAAVSTDAGATWTFRSTGSLQRTEGLAAAGATHAWVVNREGEIRHTSNAGVTWTTQASGTTDDLKDVQMLDLSLGYAVGGDNVVLKTTNGGATWTNVATSGVSGNGLFFLNASTGWVVSDAGQIWFTPNGGASWTPQPSGTTQSFNRVHFPSQDRGYAVGDGGTVVRFTDAQTGSEGMPMPAGVTLAVGPNPIAGLGHVSLTLDRPQTITVAVFDGLGRRVATLHMGELAAGAHSMQIDGSTLYPGTYVVRAVGATGAVSGLLVVR